MRLKDVVEGLRNFIISATGCVDVVVNEVNGYTVELHMIYPDLITLGDLLRSITSLKRLMHARGLRVLDPTLDSLEGSLHVVVKVAWRNSGHGGVI